LVRRAGVFLRHDAGNKLLDGGVEKTRLGGRISVGYRPNRRINLPLRGIFGQKCFEAMIPGKGAEKMRSGKTRDFSEVVMHATTGRANTKVEQEGVFPSVKGGLPRRKVVRDQIGVQVGGRTLGKSATIPCGSLGGFR